MKLVIERRTRQSSRSGQLRDQVLAISNGRIVGRVQFTPDTLAANLPRILDLANNPPPPRPCVSEIPVHLL